MQRFARFGDESLVALFKVNECALFVLADHLRTFMFSVSKRRCAIIGPSIGAETVVTDEELKELVASIAIAQKETDRLQKENQKGIAELRLSQQETDRQLQETGRQLRKQLKELGKQIGGLGDKFGGFTEGMAFPSMTKILTEQFGMEVITPRLKARKGGDSLELDVFAYANSDLNEAFVVEVKSHLRPEGIHQLRDILQRFRKFFPEHGDKRLYGMLAVVDAPDDLRQEALAEGFYMAGIHDQQFVIETPEGFVPKSW